MAIRKALHTTQRRCQKGSLCLKIFIRIKKNKLQMGEKTIFLKKKVKKNYFFLVVK